MNLIQQIKATQRHANISDDAHRQNVLEVSRYRVSTCTKLTIDEQKKLLSRYRGMNVNKPKAKAKLPEALRHIYRLWGLLARKGLVDVDSKQACETFCAKYTNGQSLYNAKKHWQRLIEILKNWLERGQTDVHNQRV
ncbi:MULTISPECIES: phage protein GemA/Gp16 family protein [Pseudoalteromonas]|uniref:GemA protein n=1 Tax=Pseudoalteromonas amylolytica TaxID=1859457 RepID=A0A1S1MXG7_9GAMM|nr:MULTISPECIES: phage protein GemA/Gp16 family protein [Pseudoalteromonas]OHU85501.1 hypothetical protein BFC16_19325 [Pseudoalteromonas sp. JW3]OHU91735.1 hypothetical protein BET10_08020 [Pseudoalteromonas amylolytica]